MESNATPALPDTRAPALEDDPVFEQVRREVARIGHSHEHARLDRLLGELDTPIVFVDLETTGGSAQADRITEIGLVEISRSGVDTWSSLVDPEQEIPPFIQDLTGISNEMVRGQPVFTALADTLAARLEGKLFVAHNARFDYGFLQRAFERAGIRFEADMLCTVQLSRALFPTAARHGLSALIERFSLEPLGRHRALADADLVWQFWQVIHAHHPAERIQTAIESLTRRPAAKDSSEMNETRRARYDEPVDPAPDAPRPSAQDAAAPDPTSPLTSMPESNLTSGSGSSTLTAASVAVLPALPPAEPGTFELRADEAAPAEHAKPRPIRARTRRRAIVAPDAQMTFEWDKGESVATTDDSADEARAGEAAPGIAEPSPATLESPAPSREPGDPGPSDAR